jgi:hypothetical protein
MGKAPALVLDDGKVLIDSAGIIDVLHEKVGPEKALIPPSGSARLEALHVSPQYLVPVESVPTQASLLLAMYAAARTIPLALFALGAIYKQAAPALLILGALAGVMQLLDAGIGLFEHDPGKCAGPLFISVLQFIAVYLLRKSMRITPQTIRV